MPGRGCKKGGGCTVNVNCGDDSCECILDRYDEVLQQNFVLVKAVERILQQSQPQQLIQQNINDEKCLRAAVLYQNNSGSRYRVGAPGWPHGFGIIDVVPPPTPTESYYECQWYLYTGSINQI